MAGVSRTQGARFGGPNASTAIQAQGESILYVDSHGYESLAVLACIRHLKIDYIKITTVRCGETCDNSSAVQSMNFLGKVPTLDDKGFVIWESRAIMRYLIYKHHEKDHRTPLYPNTRRTRARIDRMLDFDLGTLSQPHKLTIDKKLRTGEDQDATEYHKVLQILDTYIGTNQWVAGTEEVSVADLAIGAAMSNAMDARFDFSPHPNIIRWWSSLKASAAYWNERIPLASSSAVVRQISKGGAPRGQVQASPSGTPTPGQPNQFIGSTGPGHMGASSSNQPPIQAVGGQEASASNQNPQIAPVLPSRGGMAFRQNAGQTGPTGANQGPGQKDPLGTEQGHGQMSPVGNNLQPGQGGSPAGQGQMGQGAGQPGQAAGQPGQGAAQLGFGQKSPAGTSPGPGPKEQSPDNLTSPSPAVGNPQMGAKTLGSPGAAGAGAQAQTENREAGNQGQPNNDPLRASKGPGQN